MKFDHMHMYTFPRKIIIPIISLRFHFFTCIKVETKALRFKFNYQIQPYIFMYSLLVV